MTYCPLSSDIINDYDTGYEACRQWRGFRDVRDLSGYCHRRGHYGWLTRRPGRNAVWLADCIIGGVKTSIEKSAFHGIQWLKWPMQLCLKQKCLAINEI